MNWIQTYSGHRVWPLNARHPENVFCIDDIAHALANTCRFGGHVKSFYSVAEHCYLGSKVIDQQYALAFLMHDAAEAYLHDISRPIKSSLAVMDDDAECCLSFKRYEGLLDEVIFEQLDLVAPNVHVHQAVKAVDDAMLVREASELFPTGQRPEWEMHTARGWASADVVPLCWDPPIAERKFLERFMELTRKSAAA